jgi:error-prone DNA polymerase
MQLTLQFDPTVATPELPDLTTWERMLADYALTSVSVDVHPLTLLRPHLPADVLPSDVLNEAPHRSRVAFAGMAVARQRPATANGIVFMLLEDELGQVNLIVSPEVYERNRPVVRGEPLLLVRGRFERIKENRNIVVDSLESLGPLARRVANGDVGAALPSAHHFAESQRPAALSAASSRSAVLTRPMCENACGKFPTRPPSPASYSSDSRPTSLRSPSSRS